MAEKRHSAFDELGLGATISAVIEEIQALYTLDAVPWVVGYSGGKDSSAILQLVWMALAGLPSAHRRKPVYVISTDTLVENPIVALWVERSLIKMAAAASGQSLPVLPNRLTPAVEDSFWVNLIGKGYPAPRNKFRWCTERLKIKPSNQFITTVVRDNGEAILVLGTRKAESSKRAATMAKHEAKRIRERLSPNSRLPNCLVYTPIEDWTNDDVWLFLMQYDNPWGYDNKALLTMYQGASADGECPLVVDSNTPSCGDSRFGCWVCTVVEQDKSMAAMIQNDSEKDWMRPLLALRNELDVPDDRHLRDFRRLTGSVQLFHDRPIPGPYTQQSRANWLRKLLQAQRWVREHGPEDVRELELITLPELEEIRRIWLVEKHEIEDLLPRIFEEETSKPFPGSVLDDGLPFGFEEMELLREICDDDRLQYELARDLIDVARSFRGQVRRKGLFDELEKAIKKGFYTGQEDAIELALRRKQRLQDARKKLEPSVPGVVLVNSDPEGVQK
jgi:DNA sulfur modification protein DndC